MTAEPLLSVDGLTVEILGNGVSATVLNGVSFDLYESEVLGIVGESGSGKTLTALSLLGLLPPTARIVAGSIRFQGHELVSASEEVMQSVRGKEIAMVFQDPSTSLNPAFRVGWQVAEPMIVHNMATRTEAAAEAETLLRSVGFADASERARSYPHELSGGMKQRAMIASALSVRPKILIADEPTTALDVTVQAEILDLLHDRVQGLSMGTLLVTHDLGVVAETCDRVLVLYGGRVAELGDTGRVFSAPMHPYTKALLNSTPRLQDEAEELIPIVGNPVDPLNPPPGCVFHPRCPLRMDKCEVSSPPLTERNPGHVAACWATTSRVSA